MKQINDNKKKNKNVKKYDTYIVFFLHHRSFKMTLVTVTL
jgi:hypothetical protein